MYTLILNKKYPTMVMMARGVGLIADLLLHEWTVTLTLTHAVAHGRFALAAK